MLLGHRGHRLGTAPSRAQLAGAVCQVLLMLAGWAQLPCVRTAAQDGAHPGILGQRPVLAPGLPLTHGAAWGLPGAWRGWGSWPGRCCGLETEVAWSL